MEKKTKKLSRPEQIKQIKQDLISNSKDAKWAKQLISKLVSLQKQEDVEPVELIVPTKEVKESIDFGPCKISRTTRGFLFEAKGGLKTFIEFRMSRVCVMFRTLFELHGKVDKTDDEKELYDSFSSAVLYVCQALIFSSLNEASLFNNAANILKTFNEYCQENADNIQPSEENEIDMIQFANMDAIYKAETAIQ